MDVIVSELSNCLTDHQIMDKHNIPNATFYRYKKMIKHRITDTLARQTDEDLALATMLLERRFSAGYRNARAKADNSSNSGEAYHFESLSRQYAWDLYTIQREGVIAAVQQANRFDVANNNGKNLLPLTPSVVSNGEEEKARLELVQKRYLEIIELVGSLQYCKNPTVRTWNPDHVKEMDEEAAQAEKKLFDTITGIKSKIVLEVMAIVS
jgi:hypothetical protein